jgi:hypothetical protein
LEINYYIIEALSSFGIKHAYQILGEIFQGRYCKVKLIRNQKVKEVAAIAEKALFSVIKAYIVVLAVGVVLIVASHVAFVSVCLAVNMPLNFYIRLSDHEVRFSAAVIHLCKTVGALLFFTVAAWTVSAFLKGQRDEKLLKDDV